MNSEDRFLKTSMQIILTDRIVIGIKIITNSGKKYKQTRKCLNFKKPKKLYISLLFSSYQYTNRKTLNCLQWQGNFYLNRKPFMYRITFKEVHGTLRKYMYQKRRDIIVRTYSPVIMKARKLSLFYFPGWVGLKCAFCI